MKVTADQNKCCGAGNCVLLVPEVFDQREEDGIVVLLDEEPPEHLRAAVREASDMCPASAIAVHEDT
ncbi:ferredoxin [Streptomyces acidicola]|uniref:Ferredoxin n=1 Tax=Streptomyces acidicola TaxID=2596892 RepID=A0A5N8WUU8_9ACTN|nr:ferredoxin [Streptomyces acidicola]MPY50005.1 ferredoxin [Streptomyces acidicola]